MKTLRPLKQAKSSIRARYETNTNQNVQEPRRGYGFLLINIILDLNLGARAHSSLKHLYALSTFISLIEAKSPQEALEDPD